MVSAPEIADSNTRVLTVGIDDITSSDLAKISILKATTLK